MKARCSIDPCSNEAHAKGLCRRHYNAARRAETRKPRETAEAKILRLIQVDLDSGCWVWTGPTNEHGYGILYHAQTRCYAHRAAYELWVGLIPDGMVLDHVRARGCTTTACVNPAHLEAVTPTTNTMRGDSPWADRARRTHCLRGHPFDEENTVAGHQGYRECRACIRWRSLNRPTRACPLCGGPMTPKSRTCRSCWLCCQERFVPVTIPRSA